jgi:hypothetical protein
LLPEGDSECAEFGFADDLAGVVGAENGAADLIVMVGFGFPRLIDFVEEAEAVNVVGFGVIRVMANQQAAETTAWVDHVA